MAARAAVLLLLAACIGAAQGQLVIEQAKRAIDISAYVVRTQTQLTVRNDGKAEAATLLLCDPQAQHLAYLEVDQAGTKLKWAVPAEAPVGVPEGVACREFHLAAPLKKGSSAKLSAVAAHTHVLRPEPAEVKQRDPQYVVYGGTAQLASPYKVEEQTTEVKAGGDVQSWSKVEPSKRSGSRVSYGPYKDAAPWTAQPFSVHSENSAPFITATELERVVEVSHWGNVYFEERYNLRHMGAKVAGEWSRFDVQTNAKLFAKASVPAFVAALPPSAHSLFFRDSIGNISSSETRRSAEGVQVNLQPRYPLFGGWATKFLFGWSQPLPSTVSQEPSTGRMRFTATLGPSLVELVVDELVVKIVLPEGARDPRVTSEVPLSAEPVFEHKITYLDLMGRPVVVLRARNLVQELNRSFEVSYVYSSLGLLQKPLLLVAAFGLVFAVSILLNRGGLSLGSSPSVQGLAKAHAA